MRGGSGAERREDDPQMADHFEESGRFVRTTRAFSTLGPVTIASALGKPL